MEALREKAAERGYTIDDALEAYIQSRYDDDWDKVEGELNKHEFQYFNIDIQPGECDGFSLDIDPWNSLVLESWKDREAANKEITEIKQLLIACAGMGMVACVPNVDDPYMDYDETIKCISAAIKEMRRDLKLSPTVAQFRKSHGQ